MATFSITFPTRNQLVNFMNLINSYTGYSLDGFYGQLEKPQSGQVRITQALPHMQVLCDWKTSGSTVTIDLFQIDRFDPFKRQQVLDHFRMLANWQGAGLSR